MAKKQFEDEDEVRPHKKKKPKHSKNIRGHGMRVINNYEEDDFDDDPFDDEIGIEDEIFITHTKHR